MSIAAAKAKANPQADKAAQEPEEPELPPVDYVTIKSAGGHEFRILKDCAVLSGAIRAMLKSSFVESDGVVEFKEIPKHVMEKIVQYVVSTT